MQAKRKRKDHIGKTLKQILTLEYREEEPGISSLLQIEKMFANSKDVHHNHVSILTKLRLINYATKTRLAY